MGILMAMLRVRLCCILQLPILLTLVNCQQELQVKWKDSVDVVELSDPPEDLKKNRILAALAGQPASFSCSVDFAAENVDIKFEPSQNINIENGAQSVDNYDNQYFLEKAGTVSIVESDMDDATIQCKYDIQGGSGRSVSMTLSVWSVRIIADAEICEKAHKIDIEVKESKSFSDSEENVLNNIKDKLVKTFAGGFVEKNGVFKKKIGCQDLVNNKEAYKNAAKYVEVSGHSNRSLDDFLKREDGSNLEVDTGSNSTIIAVVVVAVVVVIGLVLSAGGYYYKIHYRPLKTSEEQATV